MAGGRATCALILLAAMFGLPACAGGGDAEDLLAAINRFRKNQDLPVLMQDGTLAKAALEQARHLASTGRLEHLGAGGAGLESRLAKAGYPYRLAAENLAHGTDDSKEVSALWQESPPHRRNLLGHDFREAGIGREGGYWVLILGARMGETGR